MTKTKTEYQELAQAKVTENRNVIISRCSRGGFTIAQQLIAKEAGERETVVFLKGAFHVDQIDGLYQLRDAINLAIKISEESKGEIELWDHSR